MDLECHARFFSRGTKEMMYMKVATEEINSHIHKWL
jgi:hypothetical protein